MSSQSGTLMSSFSLLPTATSNPFSQKPQLFSTLLYSLVPIIGLAAVVLFSFWMWRHHKLAYPAALVPTHVSVNNPRLRVFGPSSLLPSVLRGHLSIKAAVSSFFKVAADAVRVSLFVCSTTGSDFIC